MKRLHLLLLCGLLTCMGWAARAQGFDDLKRAKSAQLNSKLQAAVDKNDARELAKLLKSKPEFKEDGSRMGKNDKGGPLVIPLLYDIVDRTLNGEVSLELCKVALDAGCDVYSIFNGKTPIYRIMDYFATTPSAQAGVGMDVLNLFFDRKEFDINRRYRSLPPPFSYLLSANYSFLGERYDKDYLSTELLRSIIDHGGRLNTYDENGASLLLLANSTQNDYLQNYLLDNGVNLDKTADAAGNNAVYATIEKNDVEQLRKIVANYQFVLTTPYVRDYTGHVSKDMYDYLASECARNANTYEELFEYRQHFSGDKNRVQQKYEALARKETASAQDFEAIMLVIRRYPDEEEITEPKRRSIYQQHLEQVETSYKKALAAAKSDNYKATGNQRCVTDFVANYSNKSNYDPEKKVGMARRLADFHMVCEGLAWNVGSEYHGKETVLASLLLDKPYYFDEKSARRDTSVICSARRAAWRGLYDESNEFREFYQNHYNGLVNKESELFNNINRSIAFVNTENQKAKREAAKYSSSSSHSSSSSSSRSSAQERSEEREERVDSDTRNREETSSSPQKKKCSVKVYIRAENGHYLVAGYLEARLYRTERSTFWNTIKCWIDGDGYGTFTWDEDEGTIIKSVYFSDWPNNYYLEGLNMRDGESHSLRLKER